MLPAHEAVPGGSLPPTRIVTLSAAATELVCALEGGDRLVGRSHACDHPGWVRRLPAVTSPARDLAALPKRHRGHARALAAQSLSVHTTDVAALDALAPDLVVTEPRAGARAPSAAALEAAVREGVRSRPAIVSLRGGTLAGLWGDLRALSSALGVPERGVQLVSRLQQRMRAIAERLAERPRPRVACLEGVEPLRSAGRWTPELVALAGGEDALAAEAPASGRVSLASLLRADPDVVFITGSGAGLAATRERLASLAADPRWRRLRAVREGRVFLGEGDALFGRAGPRVAEALECLAETLHPGAFRFEQEGRGWARVGGTSGRGAGHIVP